MEEKSIIVDAWFEEKVIHSLNQITRATHWAQRLEERTIGDALTAEEKRRTYEILIDEVLSGLYAAIYDLTKVASVLRKEKAWRPTDPKEIFDDNQAGLAKVLARYDLSDWLGPLHITTLSHTEKVKMMQERVKELSFGSVGENRTLIYDELLKVHRDPIAQKIFDLIEPVTHGNKSWQTFQNEVQEFLKDK